jgi:hypothetical protein
LQEFGNIDYCDKEAYNGLIGLTITKLGLRNRKVIVSYQKKQQERISG